jgi:5-formyltetrahydrofolate cyclo-ligase
LNFIFFFPGGLDVILVPGLAFTVQGARLGRGKACYDNYLKKCTTAGFNPCTVALAFHQQVVDYVPVGDSDQLIQQMYANPKEI